MEKEYWINGKLTDLTLEEAKLKLIEVKGYGERYFNIHDKWTEAINIAIEAITRIEEQQGENT